MSHERTKGDVLVLYYPPGTDCEGVDNADLAQGILDGIHSVLNEDGFAKVPLPYGWKLVVLPVNQGNEPYAMSEDADPPERYRCGDA